MIIFGTRYCNIDFYEKMKPYPSIKCPVCRLPDKVYSQEDFPNMHYHGYCKRCKIVFNENGQFLYTEVLAKTKK